MRPDKDLYFLTITQAVSLRSTCLSRNVGCVLVDHNYHIMSTGYNGPASQQPLCNPCHRKGSPSGVGLLDSCVAIHAEQNALLQCPDVMRIYTAYVTVSPCLTCIKLLMNTGCQRIVFMNYYAHEKAEEMWKSLGREWIHYTADDNVVEVFNRMSEIRKSHKLLILNNNL